LIAGIGLGAIVSGMKHISDDCFLVSARCLSEQATPEDLKAGCLFPALENIRAVSAKVRASRQYQHKRFVTSIQVFLLIEFLQVAAAVAEFAWNSGVASGAKPEDVLGHVTSVMWDPVYPQTASAL
jgi:malic enzyme